MSAIAWAIFLLALTAMDVVRVIRVGESYDGDGFLAVAFVAGSAMLVWQTVA